MASDDRAFLIDRRFFFLVVVFFLTACGRGATSAGSSDAASSEIETAPKTYEVQVDASTGEFTGSFHRFFPDQVTVHPGDTVVFRRADNGEPHTVTLATEPPTRGTPGAEFFVGGFGGPPREDTSMPCVLSEGLPPPEGCSPAQQEPAAFDGTQSWFNSGGLLNDEEFVIELADDVAPGNYLFVCLVHTPLMKATIEVVEPGEVADDPVEVIARGNEDLEREIAKGRRIVEDPPTPVPGEVTAATADATFMTWVNEFSPEDIEIPVGGTVTWTIRGLHTISFNAPESARPLYERADDGSVRENELGAKAQGDPTGWDGSGMLNSGLQEGLFPPARFSATFTAPGTYPYRCLVHFDMEGKIKVGR